MNLAFFIVGGVIFGAYIYFTIWNIFYGARKQREENYPNYYDRHGQMVEPKADDMDMDGMGNFSRFPNTKSINKRRVNKMDRDWKSRRKEKVS
jgi:hypothetical protein